MLQVYFIIYNLFSYKERTKILTFMGSEGGHGRQSYLNLYSSKQK